MSPRARLVVAVARALATGDPVGSRHLFLALGESATIGNASPTCNFLYEHLGSLRLHWTPDHDAIISDAATRTVVTTRGCAAVIHDAAAISEFGTGHAEVHARHLLVALLVLAKRDPESDFAQWFASNVKESPAALYRAFVEAIRPTVPAEEMARWDATWFTGEEPPVAKAAPTSAGAPAAAPSDTVLAGYSNDAVDGPDLLDLDDEIDGLAQLLIARETVPPMSIGLFGEWGSGKSFFMRLLEERMARISENCRGKAGAAFCCDVIPIKFNAWHYVDANLWASLASHIFESLKDHLAPPSAGEDRRALVTRQLESARSAVGETEERRKQAATKADAATVRVAALRKAAFGVSAWIQVAQLPDVRARLEEATAQLNLHGNAAAVERIAGTFSEMSSVGARAMVTWRAFWSREPWKIALTLLAIIGLPAAGWELGKIVASDSSGWKQAAGAVAGFLVSAGPVVVDLLAKAKRAVGVFEEISRRVQPIIERADKDAEEITKKGEGARGKAEEELRGAEAAERAARAEVQALEAQLVELRAGQQLFRFVEGRAGDGGYQGHLGLIARVRRDFEALTTLLDRSATEEADGDPATPRADRIILFIDDLDRCPEERVVEVLQALHLLLAFQLFVVVVAVDQRWLFQSLRHHYRALHQESAETRSAGAAWESTPQDYLEKIFQIPYTLRPMDAPAFKKLIANLAPAMDAAPPAPPSMPDRASRSSFGVAAPAATTPAVDAGSVNIGGTDMTDAAPAGDPAPPPPPALPVNPPALKLHHWEVDFLQQLAPLLSTPRSAKRLVNVYRLIRAFHARDELDAFVGTAESPGHFRAAALLLALQFGFPHETATFYQKLASQPEETWLPILETLDQRGGRGRVMADAIRQIGSLESTIPASQLRRWAPSVARFSFAGKS